MNCILLADKPGIPIVLVVLGVLFLVFGGRRLVRRARTRDENDCRRGSGWGLVPLVVVLAGLGIFFNQGRHDDDFETLNGTRDVRIKAPRSNAMIAVTKNGTAVMSAAAAPVDMKAAPAPALVEWSAFVKPDENQPTEPAPLTKATEAQPVAASKEVALADSPETPAKTEAARVVAPRPAWVDAAPAKSDGVYRTKASSGPWSTEAECEKALNEDLRRVVAKYRDDLRSDGMSISGDVPLSYIKKNILKESYRELIDSPTVGPMFQLHALLEFSPQVQQELQDRYRSSVVRKRLEVTAVSAAAIFALLGSLFGFLKFDTLTQGKYRWRSGFAIAALWATVLFAIANG